MSSSESMFMGQPTRLSGLKHNDNYGQSSDEYTLQVLHLSGADTVMVMLLLSPLTKDLGQKNELEC